MKEIDLFDAIEFSHFYTRWFDFNRPAVNFARELGRPLLGISDGHLVQQSWVPSCTLNKGGAVG